MRPLCLAPLLALAVAACGGEEPPRAAEPVAETRTAAPSAEGPARSSRATVSVLARGLEVPWDIAFLPDRRALVTERPGRVRLLDARGRLRAAPVARVQTQAQGEGGLLGIAVDPEFAQGRRFVYLYVTTAQGMQVQRWRMRGTRLIRDAVVLGGIRAGSIHDSGRLRFGPDDRLYIATGDAGQRQLAQQRDSPNGKILRLEPRQYRGRADRATVFSLGHRNPQGLAWQPGSDRLFATEHGPSGFDGPSGDDEVNVAQRGRNYGWPSRRGREHAGFAAPAFVWSRTVAPSGAAFVTRGGSAWSGDLLVAALKGRALHRLRVSGARITGDELLLRERYGRLRAVEEAPDGSIWVTTSNRDSYGSPVSRDDDRILRVVPPAG